MPSEDETVAMANIENANEARRSNGPPGETDKDVREILEQCRRIAVVGAKDQPLEDAFRVPRFMQQLGYEIVPVNPKLERVFDEPAVASLLEIEGAVDLVNLFRAPEHIPTHTDEILAMSPRPHAVWMQLGILCGESAARLRAAGIRVVQDRCIMVEHRRLVANG